MRVERGKTGWRGYCFSLFFIRWGAQFPKVGSELCPEGGSGFIAFIQHYAKDVMDYEVWAAVYMQPWDHFWPVFGLSCFWGHVGPMSHVLWGMDWRQDYAQCCFALGNTFLTFSLSETLF